MQWWDNGAQVRDELPSADHRYRDELIRSTAATKRRTGPLLVEAGQELARVAYLRSVSWRGPGGSACGVTHHSETISSPQARSAWRLG